MCFPPFSCPSHLEKTPAGRDQFQKDIKIFSEKVAGTIVGSRFRLACAEQVSDADVATCAVRWRTVARRVVTIAASIPEDAADSPASSEYLMPRHVRTRVRMKQRLPSLSLRAPKVTAKNFSCRVSFPRIESRLFPEVNPLFFTAAYYRAPALISTMPRQTTASMPRMQCSAVENSVSADFVRRRRLLPELDGPEYWRKLSCPPC